MTRLPDELKRRLRGVRSVGAITGAGISAESGIQTYRGQGGIYDDPEDGERTVEALSGHTLLSDPDRTWRAVSQLARQAVGARPNPAHHALVDSRRQARAVRAADAERRRPAPARRQPQRDRHPRQHPRDRLHVVQPVLRFAPDELISIEATPRCDRCQGRLRPNAVLFDELLPTEKMQRIDDEFHVAGRTWCWWPGPPRCFPTSASRWRSRATRAS